MANVLSRLAHGIARIPRRVLAAAGWAYMEPTGFGVESGRTGEVEEMETQRRQARETWRKSDDEGPPKT